MENEIDNSYPHISKSKEEINISTNGLNYDEEKAPIFFTFPDYRDVLCSLTLHNIFIKSFNPSRVFVSVVQEIYESVDDECLNLLREKIDISKEEKVWLENNIYIFTKPAKLARGLHRNQFQAERFVNSEKDGFVIKIDSHSDFLLNYDKLLIRTFNSIGDENGILSGYPLPMNKIQELGYTDNLPPVFGSNCPMRLEPHWKFFYLPVEMETSTNDFDCFKEKGYCKTYFLVGGFAFARRHFVEKVEYDKYLEFLFFGEQFLRSARAFTHGYNIYIPGLNYIFHYYSLNWRTRYKIQMDKFHDEDVYARSVNRMKRLLGLNYDSENVELRELERFGMGNIRSIEEFWKVIGIEKEKDYNEGNTDENLFIYDYCHRFKEMNGGKNEN